MDCFSKLPPELRIRIFSQFSSTTTIFRLIQASPIMFSQYRASKTTIRRHYVVNLLNGDRYEQLLQDALGLLYLELADNRPDNHVMRYIIRQWASKALPNPFEKKDQATIDDLYKLFSHMSMFVEDFISKATSSNPPQAYLCLPQIEIPSRGLYYNQHSFCPEHVTLDELTSSECQLLAWAFIRYDMLCKIDGHKTALLLDDGEYSAITKKVLYELANYEQEAVCCVFEYIKAVHGALYTVSTRCSTRHASSALRDNFADPVRLLYPDNLYFNPIVARKDMKLPQQCIPEFALCKQDTARRYAKLVVYDTFRLDEVAASVPSQSSLSPSQKAFDRLKQSSRWLAEIFLSAEIVSYSLIGYRPSIQHSTLDLATQHI
ncbi:hypothetical protein FOYG_13686 [Fusarium oxysporum NRRL 32931]|uniref:Uncharacterized protein n=1 Tax=Fusarium oxysporum NRRL 32931 TaxID=660029 RepID=W9HUQ0_FUSOX|nr:hypothetical protein FOYG_13686 [Fusarium oxysporum NRRL 32931]